MEMKKQFLGAVLLLPILSCSSMELGSHEGARKIASTGNIGLDNDGNDSFDPNLES
jgi:hypothetical protein